MSEQDGLGAAEADGGREGGPEHVGSLAEEATRLLGSLGAWARDHGGELGQELGHGVEDLAGHVGETLHDLDEHLATGAAECTVCPLCRTVHAVRHLNPEVRGHLTAAATSLVQAAAALLAAPERGARTDGAHRSGDPGVERIDLTDSWPEESAETRSEDEES